MTSIMRSGSRHPCLRTVWKTLEKVQAASLLDALEQGITPGELAARLDGRALSS